MKAGLLLATLFVWQADASWCDAGFVFTPPECGEIVETPVCNADSNAHPR